MEGIRKILYPASLTEASPRIVPYVSLMAERFGAEIHLLYVAQAPDRFMGTYVKAPIVEDFTNELVKAAREQLLQFKEKHFEGFASVSTAVLSGDRSEKILAYIQSEGIDLVIMGAQTRAGLEVTVVHEDSRTSARGAIGEHDLKIGGFHRKGADR